MEPDASGDVRNCYALCPLCGNFAHLSENLTYCMVCGEKLQKACPGCGKAIRYPTARYCPGCGQQLTQGLSRIGLDAAATNRETDTIAPTSGNKA